MARRQAEIPGFERQVENPAVEEAATKYLEIMRERAELSKKEGRAKLDLLAVMRANNVEQYEFPDDSGEIMVVRINTKENVKIDKSGETNDDPGEGIDGPEDVAQDGLLADARKVQQDANVEETTDGDVTVPDTAAPKKGGKRGGKKGAKA